MRGKIEDRDQRNYMREASRLVTGLSIADLYKLFEIVVNEQSRFCKPERRKELEAVQEVIKNHPMVEKGRIDRILRGPSEMARTAKPKDGYTKPNSKKA